MLVFFDVVMFVLFEVSLDLILVIEISVLDLG